MSSARLYDSIGAPYPLTRRTEPRIAARIWDALGDARTVLNVGAGTGSYEPFDRELTAVEPSGLMRGQRPRSAARCVGAVAERLPFDDQCFDAAMAVSTIHHWSDPMAGLRELQRVARRVVVFTHDDTQSAWLGRFWLTRDYLPEVADLIVGRPSLSAQASAIGARVEPVGIPWDCADGFFEAYWRRRTWTSVCGVQSRSGPGSEQRPSNEPLAACAMTSPRAGGQNAIASSSRSARRSSDSACSSPPEAGRSLGSRRSASQRSRVRSSRSRSAAMPWLEASRSRASAR